MNENKVKKVIEDLINIHKHKLVYAIQHKDLVQGMINTFAHYDIKYTEEVHNLLVEAIQEKLEGPDIEREWTEKEYNNFIKYKGE